MYNLIRFIKLNQFILLFLFIEGISIFLLLSQNNYQTTKITEQTSQYTSVIYKYSSIFRNYINLTETNKYLAQENAKLYSMLKNQQSFHDSILIRKKDFSYQSAKVINNSVNKRNNFITLNKGKRDGVKKGMGVITSNGVIGIIHSLSENYSIVISTLHRKSSLAIKILRNNQHGILKWEGFDYKKGNIKNFPNHILLKEQDTVITSSHSIIFPEGINVGTISSFKQENEGYYNVEVDFFEDFNQLNFVYVIASNKTEEQRKLEKNISNE